MPLFRSRVVRLSAAGLERLSALWYSAAWLMSDLPEKTGQLLTDMGPILCRKIGRRDTLRVSNPFYPLPHSLSRQWAIIKPQPILADLALQLDQASEPGRNDGRSEEHTSELQSLMRISYAVFCLKKKTIQN